LRLPDGLIDRGCGGLTQGIVFRVPSQADNLEQLYKQNTEIIAQSLREMQIEAPLDPRDAARVRSGMSVSFAVDALPRRRFLGEVREPRKAAVVIAAPNADLVLLPGMTAKLRIVLESRANVLKVPNAALDGAGERVWVLEAGKPKPVAVRLGVTDGVSTELVHSPLAEGAQVIIGTL